MFTASRGFIYSPDITSAFRFQCFPRFRRFVRNNHSTLAFHLQSLQHSGLLLHSIYSVYSVSGIVLQRLRAFRPFSICFQGFSLEFLRPSGTPAVHHTTSQGPSVLRRFALRAPPSPVYCHLHTQSWGRLSTILGYLAPNPPSSNHRHTLKSGR